MGLFKIVIVAIATYGLHHSVGVVLTYCLLIFIGLPESVLGKDTAAIYCVCLFYMYVLFLIDDMNTFVFGCLDPEYKMYSRKWPLNYLRLLFTWKFTGLVNRAFSPVWYVRRLGYGN